MVRCSIGKVPNDLRPLLRCNNMLHLKNAWLAVSDGDENELAIIERFKSARQ